MPSEAAYFDANYQSYSKKLTELDQYIIDRIKEIPAKHRYLITSHDAFAYFGKRYDIQVEGIVGTSTESEAQTSDIRRIQKIIKESGVPAIFVESTINPKLIEQIAKDSNIKVGGSLFADSLGPKDSKGNTYYNMMKSNIDDIANALTKSASGASDHDHAPEKSSSWMIYLFLGIAMLLVLLLLMKKMNS